MIESEKAEQARARLEVVKTASQNWCDELYRTPNGRPYYCRRPKGHDGDHNCPAHVEGK